MTQRAGRPRERPDRARLRLEHRILVLADNQPHGSIGAPRFGVADEAQEPWLRCPIRRLTTRRHAPRAAGAPRSAGATVAAPCPTARRPSSSPLVREPAPFVTRCRSRTVANGDSIRFDVRRCRQCSAGKSKNASSASWSSTRQAVGFGYFASNPRPASQGDFRVHVEGYATCLTPPIHNIRVYLPAQGFQLERAHDAMSRCETDSDKSVSYSLPGIGPLPCRPVEPNG